MKKTILLATFVLFIFASALAQQPPPADVHPESGTWVKVAPANAGFTVMMPAAPSETTPPASVRPDVESHMLGLETKLIGYVLSYTLFPREETDPAGIKMMLDRGRDGGIAASQGKLISEKEIKLNDYSGREWQLELPGELLGTVRAYWVKRRLYQTVVITSANKTGPAAITKLTQEASSKFLDSFTLVGDNLPE